VRDGAIVEWGLVRWGNFLREALGRKAITVFLHAPWNGAAGYNADFVHPADGRLDAFMLAREGGPSAEGFDVAGSPLGDLAIENTFYEHGYTPLTMAKFCDGWTYTKPIGEYEPVTYIEGWINEENLEYARANAMNPRWRTMSVDQLNEGCRSYQDDLRRFFGHMRQSGAILMGSSRKT
jgi:hypothetical protein